ncbi:hypothetical protein N8T08_003651 [Aspergillus melleus]|uniref:Uncharacterized protein n=1 Tax=Aspergillus melleus TaxID=138277 RepID=A0ACC3B6T4_9EURO|nr:hypothetical protein N8T08_003651 [Aspergillus melleus]
MDHNVAEFQALVEHVGSSLEEIAASNGSDGARWSTMTVRVCDEIEKADPRISAVEIK